jgi:hypothetical protein
VRISKYPVTDVTAMLTIAMTTAVVTEQIGELLAGWIILAHHYGISRVIAEHIRVVTSRPIIRVSNGDLLAGPWLGDAHLLIAVLIWFSTFSLLAYLSPRLLRLNDRATIEIRSNLHAAFPLAGIVWSVLLFVALTTSRNVSFWFGVAGATILIGAAWLRWGCRD